MEKLKAALAFGGILSGQDIGVVISYFEQQQLRAGEDFHRMGKIADRVGFVDSGALRVYAYGPDGEEVTTFFVRDNQFIMDVESFYSNRPGKVAMQAAMESTVYFMKRGHWNRLSEKIPKFYILSKSLTEAALLNKISDNDFLNFGSAKVKYLAFTERYPELALHVPLQHIASYLKITPQSLSRIRREIAGKG